MPDRIIVATAFPSLNPMTHKLPIQVYYEDTDFSGVVYHVNYFKFFERAREHYLGVELLVRLYQEQELGLVVYHMEIDFKPSIELICKNGMLPLNQVK